jgi:hypothetical protein
MGLKDLLSKLVALGKQKAPAQTADRSVLLAMDQTYEEQRCIATEVLMHPPNL